MLSPDLFTLAAGTLGGFVFKLIAQAQANRQAQFDRMMGAIKASDDSADKASLRSNDSAGNWTRRIIVLVVLFGVILGPFFLVLIDKPIIVEVQKPFQDWFFGLLSSGGNVTFYQLPGYLLSDSLRQAFMALIGFYFGQGAARVVK